MTDNNELEEKDLHFGLVLNTTPSTFAVPCTSSDCSLRPEELAKVDRNHYRDDLTSRTYCENCGNRLRYHRKKWSSRGEKMPLTLEEVNTRHNT